MTVAIEMGHTTAGVAADFCYEIPDQVTSAT
jgi:hypothetical protein